MRSLCEERSINLEKNWNSIRSPQAKMVLPSWRPKCTLSVLLRVFAWLWSTACYIHLWISRLSFKPWLCPDCVKRSWWHQLHWPSDLSFTTEFLRLLVEMYCWYLVEVNMFYKSMSYALGSSLNFKKQNLKYPDIKYTFT